MVKSDEGTPNICLAYNNPVL